MTASSHPLAGVRVLDLTRLLPGGYATQMLADLGADVLKIEEPGAGDYARTMAPLAAGGIGQAFLAVNRGKRSAALNLKHPDGRAALLRLVDSADVLIESYRPGVLDRLGLGHAALLERNPRLVVCAITGYGQNGPYSQRPGHDLNYIGYAGLLAHLTPPGRPPTLPGAQLADIGGGALMAVIGILAALTGRATTGSGGIVDVSMMEGALALLPLLASMVLQGADEPRPGEATLAGGLPCYNVYETSDGKYVTLGALEPKFWAEFCTRVGHPELIGRQFPQNTDDRDATIGAVAAILRTRTRDAWVAELAATEACLGPVNTLAEALADPQVQARQLVAPWRMTNADAEASDSKADDAPPATAALRLTPRIGDEPFTVAPGVVGLGDDTADALAEAGYTPDEIASLAASGAIALGSAQPAGRQSAT